MKNSYIEEEQTTQWPREKVQKDKQLSTKHTYKGKYRVTQTPLKTGGELWVSGRVSNSCSTSSTIYKYICTLWRYYHVVIHMIYDFKNSCGGWRLLNLVLYCTIVKWQKKTYHTVKIVLISIRQIAERSKIEIQRKKKKNLTFSGLAQALHSLTGGGVKLVLWATIYIGLDMKYHILYISSIITKTTDYIDSRQAILMDK